MAILHISKPNTYSIVDDVSISKRYKNISFSLITYENESKEVELNRKQYIVNGSIVCQEVYNYFEDHVEVENTFNETIKSFSKFIENYAQGGISFIEDLLEKESLTNKFLAILNYQNYLGVFRFIIKYENDQLIFNYEKDKSHTYYYCVSNNTYYCYTNNLNTFSVDINNGINTDHYFNKNILPYFKEDKNIIEICYKLLKIIDKNILIDTIDV